MKIRAYILIGVAGIGFWLGASEKQVTEIEDFVEEINKMRETLAHGVTGEVNADTFAAVCKPVGMKAKAMAQENHWKFRQVSHKHRNPANKPTASEASAIQRFEEDPALRSLWNHDEASRTYFRRITVHDTCLACHGDKDARPDFIKETYPDDLAWGFQEGDLRGIFSVTISSKD